MMEAYERQIWPSLTIAAWLTAKNMLLKSVQE